MDIDLEGLARNASSQPDDLNAFPLLPPYLLPIFTLNNFLTASYTPAPYTASACTT